MIFGIISAILCIFLLLKIVSRKKNWRPLDNLLRKIHIPCAFLVVILIGIHLVVTFHVWPMRSVFLIGTGIGAALLLVGMAVLYIFRKKIKSRWIILHRSFAFFLALLVISHILIYYVDFFLISKQLQQ